MAAPLRFMLNEEPCPVPVQLFGQLHKSSPPDAAEIAKTLPEAQRAQLVVFCYHRQHLRSLAFAIASTCERQSLIKAAGSAGEVIFKQSRDPHQALSSAALPRSSGQASKITLAGSISGSED